MLVRQQSSELWSAKKVRTGVRNYNRQHRKMRCVECGASDHVGFVRWTPGVGRLLCKACGGYNEDTPTLEDMIPDWMAKARCADADLENITARRFIRENCMACPVWRECARFAWRTECYKDYGGTDVKNHSGVKGGGYFFVFGGLSPSERASANSEAELIDMATEKRRPYDVLANLLASY